MALISKRPGGVRGATYKQLLLEKKFLKVQARAKKLRVDLKSIQFANDMMIWKCTSGTTPGKYWTQLIDFSNYDAEYAKTHMRPMDLVDAVREARLKIDCDCPAYLYWGYKYKAWINGYGIKRERRRPVVRNPHLQGFVCKHLFAVMQTYPFWASSVAAQLRKRLGKDGERTDRQPVPGSRVK